MSAVAEKATDAVPARKAGKKLILIAALAVLLVGGAGAAWVVKSQRDAQAAREAAEAEESEDESHGPARRSARGDDHKDKASAPTFLALDNFIVNLADRDGERFAQIGVTLELSDPKDADEIKAYMPAIRNGILMVLAHKTSQELLTREGKEKLAAEILRESLRPLGLEPPEPADAQGGKRRKPAADLPVRRVHFSNFIMQ